MTPPSARGTVVDGGVEEPTFRLVDDPVGINPRTASLSTYLRRPQPRTLYALGSSLAYSTT